MIYIYNRRTETHNKNDFYIGRGSILGNPYSHIKDRKTKAIYEAKDRDDAIDKYSYYFDLMYGSNKTFTQAIDEIYEVYKSGDDVFLGCFCKPLRCHGDVIKEKLEKLLLKERLMEKRNKNENIIQKQQMERNLG